jgi:membrane protein
MTAREVGSPPSVDRAAKGVGLVGIAKELAFGYADHRLAGLSAEAAYRLTIALPSLFVVLMTIAELVDRQTDVPVADGIEGSINNRAPAALVPLLSSLLEQAVRENSGQTLSVQLIAALLIAWWGASGSVAVVLFGCNRVYEVDDRRPWAERRLMVLVLTLLGAVVIVVTSALFAFGSRLAEWLARGLFDDRDLTATLEWYGRALQFGLLLVALLVLYRIGPAVEHCWRWLMPGALAATAGWNLALVGFSWVLSWTNPGSAYGAAGSVIALLLLLYWLVLIVLVGALINAVLGRRFDTVLIAHLDERLESRPTP